MSAGLCALFLRLPQLPSVEANAASNWATGRAWRGWAGHSAGCRWLPEMDWQALCLKTPGGGGQWREMPGQDSRSGLLPASLPWPRGPKAKRPRRLYLSRKMAGSMPPVLDISLAGVPFLREKASNLLSVAH